MREEMKRRLKKWALVAALVLANFSLILSFLFKADLLYSAGKAVMIFAVMYFICRIVIAAWDKVIRGEDFSSIKTTMEALDDLDEQGIKVTYHPLPDGTSEDSGISDGSAGGPGEPDSVLPGQINAELIDSVHHRNQ